MMQTPLEKAIYAAGRLEPHGSGLQKIASACKVKYQYIQKMRQQWRITGQPPAAMLSHAPAIEIACGGAQKVEDLYPDVEWERDAQGSVISYRTKIFIESRASDGAKPKQQEAA